MKCARPVLRYFGGKWRLAPWLISLMPKHATYVDPFCGAASVLFRKPPVERELLNDSSSSLIRYLRTVQNEGKKLAGEIRKTTITKSRWTKSLGSGLPLEMAIRSFHSIGTDGLWKNSGYRGHPIALAAWKTLPDAIRAAQERLRFVKISELDAFDVIRENDSAETFFYVDPPYVRATRSSSHVYEKEFSELDHSHLAGLLHGIVGKAMVSGYDCPLYGKLYAGWRTATHDALKDNAKKTKETVWMNY